MPVRIAVHLRCHGCRHDLKGIAPWARCPECGAQVMTTLVECTDSGVRGLMKLRQPWRVAIGLGLACAGIALWWACLSGPAGAARVLTFIMEGAPQSPRGIVIAADSLGILGLLVSSLGAWLVAPTNDEILLNEYGPIVYRTIWCLPAWCAVDAARVAGELGLLPTLLFGEGWTISMLAVETGLACVCTLGLRRAFAVLGRRSRTYREAHLARQDLDLLAMAALILLAVGTAEAVFLHQQAYDWVEIARVLEVVVGGLLGLGIIYLAANSIWIARSLMAQQIPLHEALSERPPAA